MNWLQSILYGFISGMSELIPVSSSAHQYLMLKIFGVDKADPLLSFFLHLSIIVAIYYSYKTTVLKFIYQFQSSGRRRRKTAIDNYELRFLKTASILMLLGMLLIKFVFSSTYSLADIAVISLINGLILFVSGRALQGNKDARSMSALDSAATGLLSALSVLPGMSRTGICLSYPIFRGADRREALDWAIVLSIPALTLLSAIDLIEMITMFQPMTFVVYLGYIPAIACCYFGSYIAIQILRFLAVRTGFSGFAYYSWGAALFAFILYLI